MAPTAGMLVSNNVRLVSPLAEGGMGSVWVADHLGLSTQVAVKFIAEEISKHKISVERFKREASAAAQIRSQHVVQVFDHGITEDGVPYIVMELMEGEDLGKRVERLGPLSVEMTVQVVSQACRALNRARALGIVHRDIKPDNLFICESDGEFLIKILDFGVAKKTSEFSSGVTTTGVIVGTPSYMSPEQVLSSKDVDGRSDIWSLGVVAYHCLTGKVPFDGETFGALAVAINAGTYPPLTQVCPHLPPVLDQWLSVALAKDRDRRFATAKEMSAALVRTVNPGAVNADSTGGLRPIMESQPGLLDSNGAPVLGTAFQHTAIPPTTPSPVQPGGGPPGGHLGSAHLGSGHAYAPATSTPEPSAPLPVGQQPTFDGAAVENAGGARRRGLRVAVLAGITLLIGVGTAFFVYGPGGSKVGGGDDANLGRQSAGQDESGDVRPGVDDDPSEGDGAAAGSSASAEHEPPTVSAAGIRVDGDSKDGKPSPEGSAAPASPPDSAPGSPAPASPAKPTPPPKTPATKKPRGSPTPAPFPQMDDRGF